MYHYVRWVVLRTWALFFPQICHSRLAAITSRGFKSLGLTRGVSKFFCNANTLRILLYHLLSRHISEYCMLVLSDRLTANRIATKLRILDVNSLNFLPNVATSFSRVYHLILSDLTLQSLSSIGITIDIIFNCKISKDVTLLTLCNYSLQTLLLEV